VSDGREEADAKGQHLPNGEKDGEGEAPHRSLDVLFLYVSQGSGSKDRKARVPPAFLAA